jgi:hypothetical protein
VTSDSAPNTVPSEPCETCPGSAACRLLRMSPVSAYVAGCRAQIAREGNTAAQSRRRAQRRAQCGTGADTEWDSPDTEPKPEPTGLACPQCQGPLAWAPGRAGMICPDGHFVLPPDAAERAADTIRTRTRAASVPVETRPSVADIAALDMERGRIIRACETALAELDTSGLREIAANFPWYAFRPDWNPLLEGQITDLFNSLIRQARAARNHDELREIDTAYRNAASSSEMNNLRGLIQQQVRDAASAVTYRSQGNYTARPDPENPNRIQLIKRPGLATPGSIAAQQYRAQLPPGSPERHYKPTRTLTPLGSAWDIPSAIGRSYHAPQDDDYEDDDSEDDEPERDDYGRRVYYDGNESHGNGILIMLAIFAGIIVVAYGINKTGKWFRHDGLCTCENPEHFGRPALAREQWRGPNGIMNVCHRRECRTAAHAATVYRQPYGGIIEPECYPLADAAGNPGYEITGKGKYHRNKTFTGVPTR